MKEFLNEVEVIYKFQHGDLVRLLGCCNEAEENIWVVLMLHSETMNILPPWKPAYIQSQTLTASQLLSINDVTLSNFEGRKV